jgi:hypothetical protein
MNPIALAREGFFMGIKKAASAALVLEQAPHATPV